MGNYGIIVDIHEISWDNYLNILFIYIYRYNIMSLGNSICFSNWLPIKPYETLSEI